MNNPYLTPRVLLIYLLCEVVIFIVWVIIWFWISVVLFGLFEPGYFGDFCYYEANSCNTIEFSGLGIPAIVSSTFVFFTSKKSLLVASIYLFFAVCIGVSLWSLLIIL